jgi:phage baseplate assembly protein V
MITFNDFKRLIAPLRRRVFLSLGRGILKLINNAEGTQKVMITALAGETITDAERFQEYGFETYPLTEAEVFGAFLNGNRDHGIILCVHDRRYRPKDLTAGEVALYTDEDSTNDFRFWLKRGRIASLTADQSEETLDTSKTITAPTVNINGTTITFNASGIATVTGATVIINGDNVILGDSGAGSVRKLVDERFKTLFDAHVHSGVTAGGANTGVPTALMTDAHLTSKAKAL